MLRPNRNRRPRPKRSESEAWSEAWPEAVEVVEAGAADGRDSGGGGALLQGGVGRAGRTRRAAQSELGPGQQHRVSWTPGGPRTHLGVSFCRDREQTACFMLDAQGAGQGRLGYAWRRHAAEEAGVMSWVPGRADHVPETLIRSSPPVSAPRRRRHLLTSTLLAAVQLQSA